MYGNWIQGGRGYLWVRKQTRRGQEKGFSGEKMRVSGGYTDVFILWKFIELHNLDLCIFLYVIL